MREKGLVMFRKTWRIFLFYTVIFVGIAFMIRGIFQDNGKSFIWSPDGEFLYFPIMIYTRNYLLEVVRTLLHAGQLVLPTWDFSIGQGNSILAVFQINPFFLPAMLTTSNGLEAVYGIIALLQWYCVGLVFILFCHRIGKTDTFPVLLGTLVYTFSGYAVFCGTKHIYFVTFLLIYFPLILIGAERYLQEKKWGFFVCMITLSLVGGYYYAYMNSLLMAIYVFFRQIAVNGKAIKKSIVEILKLIGFYMWALALSMIIFLPKVMNYFNCSRAGQYSESLNLFYVWPVNESFLATFATPLLTSGWTHAAFAGIAFMAVIILFMKKGRHFAVLRSTFIVLTLFMCLPMAGKIFNGFGYVTNRWCYGYAFLMAIITVFAVPAMYELSWKHKAVLTVLAGAYIAFILNYTENDIMKIGAGLLLAILAVIILLNKIPLQWVGSVLMTGVTVYSAVILLQYNYLPEYMNGISAYVDEDKVQLDMTESVEALVNQIEDDSFYRTEVRATRSNRFIITGGYGTNSYWSTLPSKMTEYYLDFALASVRQNYALWGLDERASVCTLSGVKYDLGTDKEKNLSIPYGFEKKAVVKGDEKDYAIYENKYALPLGFTYTEYMTTDDFEKLSPIERQQAMLQCAVIEDGKGVAYSQPELTVKEVTCAVSELEDVEEVEPNVFEAQAGGVITYTFEGKPDSETYLYLKNIESSGVYTSKITAKTKGVSRTTSVHDKTSVHYFEREGVTFNLGYSEEGMTTCTVTFENAGSYSFEPVIVCMPMQDYVRDVTALGEVVLENIEENGDKVTGTIHLDDSRLLVLTIPHIGGWEAYVNGEKAELLDVNTLYMGLMLDAGDYEIELRYTTPGMKLGAVISGTAFAGLILYGIIVTIKKRRLRGVNKQG